jgi:hypothetical protein
MALAGGLGVGDGTSSRKVDFYLKRILEGNRLGCEK